MKLSNVFNFKAFIYHFLFSFILIGGLSLFIVKLWYPDVWASAIGGYKLIVMMLLIDLCVGPLCVGLSYKAYKSSRTNTFDITVITLCQLAFFAWGAWTISISRPVFLVFDTDRFELVVDQDIDRSKLAESGEFGSLPLFKRMRMAIVDIDATVPDESERIEAYNNTIFGLDSSKLPQYYVPYEGEGLNKILNMAKGYEQFAMTKEAAGLADLTIAKHQLNKENFKWLPVRYFSPQAQEQLFMTAVIDDQSAEIIDYILLDPYDI